jgi:hypothetical protein
MIITDCLQWILLFLNFTLSAVPHASLLLLVTVVPLSRRDSEY